jgi:uncharacterized membrane-anchored protein YitT (DUF2179 family)
MLLTFLTHVCLNTSMFFVPWFPSTENVPLGLLSWKPFPLLATMNLWYAVPLLISVSLVCAATRQEEMGSILQHALRFAVWVVVFMGIVMIVLTLLGWLI